jgi:predicted NUDIX family NTP pyrophosphohydrolase
LIPVNQKGGKIVHAWAFEGDYEDGRPIVSNTFTMEWPPGSGRQAEFPEMDRAEFFDVRVAKRKIKPAQAALVDELERVVAK